MSMNKIYVGNLSYDATEADLDGLFAKYGERKSVRLIIDKMTGRSKGFAFIEFSTPAEAQASLELNDQEFQNRRLKVRMAKEEQRDGGGRGGFGGGRGHGGGGRGGYGGGMGGDRY